MLTESYGGKCPVCKFDRILMRYGTGFYQFDACPKCGFAYATGGDKYEEVPMETWKIILHNERRFLRDQGFPATIDGIYEWVTSVISPKPDRSRETVFCYPVEHIRKFKKSKLYKERMIKFKEKVIFT